MKILHVNTYLSGGAAKACLRLHKSLLDAGVDSEMLVLYKSSDAFPHVTDFRTYTSNPVQKLSDKIRNKWMLHKQSRRLSPRGEIIELFSFPESVWDITQSPLYKEADIIHLHWIHGFLDFKSFFAKCDKPVVWTLHDFYPFSGGFHYEEGVDLKPFRDLISKNLSLMEESLKGKDIRVICPSTYLKNASLRSPLFSRFRHEVIPNSCGLPYQPGDRSQARKRLNLPTDKKIILFVSQHLSYSRKGLNPLLDAYRKSNSDDTLLVLVGKRSANDPALPGNYLEAGELFEDEKLRDYYSAADLFVCPSLADISSNTIMEALCCGTPVVAFPSGGIPELVEGVEGVVLCPESTSEALTKGIQEGLSRDYDRNRIASSATQKYAPQKQVATWLNLYHNVLNTAKTK